MARPAKLTKAKIKKFCAEIADGATNAEAAQVVKVAPRTLREWRRRGERAEPGDELYAEFAKAYADADERRQATLVQRVREGRNIAGDHDWRASAWLLERLYPEEFARRTIKEKVIRSELEGLLDAVEPHMSREAYGELIDAIAVLHGLEGRKVETVHVVEALGPGEDDDEGPKGFDA